MTGWRKKTIIEMAREAGAVFPADGSYHKFERHEDLEAFAALVSEDAAAKERERIAKWYENAKELGLDYEPRKTIQEMVQKATGATGTLLTCSLVGIKEISDFAAMVRHDERARCISHVYGQAGSDNVAERTVRAIRSGT